MRARSTEFVHPPGTARFKQVGFFACPAGDRLVRVGHQARTPKKGESVHDLRRCPACGEPHRVKVMWRRAPRSERVAAEVVVR